jgi:hypothetical protein
MEMLIWADFPVLRSDKACFEPAVQSRGAAIPEREGFKPITLNYVIAP